MGFDLLRVQGPDLPTSENSNNIIKFAFPQTFYFLLVGNCFFFLLFAFGVPLPNLVITGLKARVIFIRLVLQDHPIS